MNAIKFGVRSAVMGAVVVAAIMLLSVFAPVAGGAFSAQRGAGGSSASVPHAASSSVAPASAAPAVIKPAATTSPHPGTLYSYEPFAGGGTTEDPDVLYDTVSEEPVMNVLQTLIAFEGTSTTQYVPEIATCVPGTAACTSLYGSSLLVNNTTTGAPEYYTFVIGPSHFYDPNTGVSWQVYPSDVMFSTVRSQIFMEFPVFEIDGDWDTGQTLLSAGNPNWDSGLHAPLNNTPQHSLTVMFVNDSTYCPHSAMTGSNYGCITFNVNGGGQNWPFFLQALTQVFAGVAVVPCGWFTAQGGGVPGFSSSAANGDGPCTLPGGATSTSASAFTSAVASMSPKAFDATELLMSAYPSPVPKVQWNTVGSGPYYLVPGTTSPAVGYQLKANPAYVQPPCGVLPGCQPAPGTYIAHVIDYWEDSDTVGIQEYTAGQADLAGILSTHTPTLLSLVAQGKAQYEVFPTLSIFFFAFDLNTSITALRNLLPSGDVVNVPGSFFSDVAVRQLSVNAWPYATYQSTINTVDGVSYGIQYGGVIPPTMAPYYPTNVSWPAGNPVFDKTVVGSAAWWWAQGTNSSSPYYSPTLAKCTSSSPCVYPVIGQLADPGLDDAIAYYIGDIEKATGGALAPYDYDISFTDAVIYSTSSTAGTSPINLYTLGWIPDYPDPSNNIAAMVQGNGTYTEGNALYQQLEPYNTSCTHNTAYASFSNLVYWANVGQIPNNCQGPAYLTLEAWDLIALHEANLTLRILYYNLVEHIMNELALYIYVSDANIVESAAPWINITSLNTNVEVGGGQDNYFFQIQYSPAAYQATFTETGLTAGTSWSVTAGAVTQSSTSSTISFTEANGTFPYWVSLVQGYSVAVVNGSFTVHGANVGVSAAFTATSGPTFTLDLASSGLVLGTGLLVLVSPGGAVQVDATSVVLPVNSGANFTYTVLIPPGYTFNGVFGTYSGVFTGKSAGTTTLALAFTSVAFPTYKVNFLPSGLGSSASWNLTMTGFLGKNYTVTSAAGTPIAVWEAAGLVGSTISGPYEYAANYTVSSPGYVASPASGTFTVQLVPGNGVVINQPVTFTPKVAPPPPPSSTPSSTYLSSLAYGIIAALVVILLIVIVLAAMMGRRRAKPPAQSWDEPKGESPGGGGSMGGSGGDTQGGSTGGPGGTS
jgi:hypothetical protein